MEDLQQLANSRNLHVRLLHKQIRAALDSGRRLERDVDAIVNSVLALARIYTNGSMRFLP